MAPEASLRVVPKILHPNDQPSPATRIPQALASVKPAHSRNETAAKKPRKVLFELKTPKCHEQQHLADTIPRFFATSTFDSQERQYLPGPCIKKDIVTKATVDGQLTRAPDCNQYNSEVLTAVSSWVVEVASKVFAITVQCHLDPNHLLWSMLKFYQEEFDDEQLPISNPTTPDAERARPDRSPAFPTNIWSDQRHDEFFRFQWSCLAPVFVQDQYEYDLLTECILPFKRLKDTDPRNGSFSSVFKVAVQSDHQHRHSSLEVAIKEMKSIGPLETEKAWDIEARALHAINQLDHSHIMKSIAAIRRGETRYFMFPWAENSLREYWNSIPAQSPSPELILEAISQFRGLADALDQLHNFQGSQRSRNESFENVEIDPPPRMDDDDDVNDYTNPLSQESIRHGDIKPENILRFPDETSKIGTLKLGDMGLAKRHVAATEKRRGTSMRYGTRRYEGPETLNDGQGRSRLYDLWSMGCITFECILWLLYGNDALAEFYRQAEKSCAPSDFQYYKVQVTGGAQHPVVNPIVTVWMDHIQKEDPECRVESDSMLKDLLHIVREKLLVVDLPPTRGSALADGSAGRGLVPAFVGEKTKYRVTAAGLRESLDVIQKKACNPQYVCTGLDRSSISWPAPPAPSTYRSTLEPSAQHTASPFARTGSKIVPLSTGVLNRTISADYSLPPLESWEFAVDNDFASKVVESVSLTGPEGFEDTRNKLCNRCARLNFWSSGFSIEDNVDMLAESATSCDLCKLLHDVSHDKNKPHIGSKKIRFERTQSVITMTGKTFPVLSLIRSPELRTPIAIQMGRPWLTDLNSTNLSDFFDLAREWLRDCDKSHVGCQVQRQYRLPTRLVDVGSTESPILRLVETQHETVLSPHYIALSHPWGDTGAYEAFVTLRKDEKAGHDVHSFKSSIPYHELPKTFKHAVDCTRNLGVRYLWIDSICIIQGDDGDFPEEAKRMEDVYSGAYCVVAASRAGDQRDGFLGARPQRKFVTIDGLAKKPFYVCQNIDRFNEDVITGSLNQRGWVLQERALARRTIYFTENQTYFECGNGVRCETLTKMHNNMADFLGDPNFPNKAMRVPSRALKIEYFQGLYKQYSRLGFTRWEDRPVAIAGLEKRLQGAFSTKGRYGIFDDGNKSDGSLFHRSLLWRRAWGTDENKDGTPLEVITFPPEKAFHVPSWSWMAYKGSIDFTDPPYRSATWETRELIPPWTRGGYQEPDVNKDVAIAAVARDFNLKGRDPDEVKIAYDTEQGSEKKRVQCVIVATSNDARSDMDRRYYVLLVIPIQDKAENERWIKYKRVGAGFMLGKYITLDKPGTEIRIY